MIRRSIPHQYCFFFSFYIPLKLPNALVQSGILLCPDAPRSTSACSLPYCTCKDDHDHLIHELLQSMHTSHLFSLPPTQVS